MKKNLLFALMLLVTAGAFAEDVEINGLWYKLVPETQEAQVIQYKNYKFYKGDYEIPNAVVWDNVSYRVTSIGYRAFSNCEQLTSVIVPSSVTSMGENAFQSCPALVSVTLGSVTRIGNSAFSGCSSLTDVTIPSSVTRIDKWAFQRCSSLTSVTIPSSVTTIEFAAFQGCSSLTAINVEEGNQDYVSDNGVLYNKDITTLIQYPSCKSGNSYTVPNSVTCIGGYAFQNCSDLFTIQIPNSVEEIEDYVFQNCINLTEIELPDGLKRLWVYVFSGCSSLTAITIPNSVVSIDGNAFDGCSNLTTVTIGSGVESILAQAFANCPMLTNVYCYAEGIYTIAYDAFKGSNVENATLRVPEAVLETYKTTEPWNAFAQIKSLESMGERCATPTIALVNGKLVFDCETEGVEFVCRITPPEAVELKGNNLSMPSTYTVTVYAKKEGCENSAPVTRKMKIGGVTGDVNGDGVVDISDYVGVANIILTGKP